MYVTSGYYIAAYISYKRLNYSLGLEILKNFTYNAHIYIIMKYCFLRKKNMFIFIFHYNLYAIKISLKFSNVQIYLRNKNAILHTDIRSLKNVIKFFELFNYTNILFLWGINYTLIRCDFRYCRPFVVADLFVYIIKYFLSTQQRILITNFYVVFIFSWYILLFSNILP